MNERTRRLRDRSQAAAPYLSAERAQLLTDFYRDNLGKHSVPVMRAMAFAHLCQHKSITIELEELIVGERGPAPKATPTFPELTCHSLEDLRILASREKTSYEVSEEVIRTYEQEVIPYWRGRSLRDRLFAWLPEDWHAAYAAGIFTEFMEQRAPGHTVADGKIYRKGLQDFQTDMQRELASLDFRNDPHASHKREQLQAMHIAADAAIQFAQRHVDLARRLAAAEADPVRCAELEHIAAVCERVPARAPRDFWEALQMYWFCHLAVVTELNGWDAFSPGHLDQHLEPFYRQGLADGSLTRESAKELLECFFVKFNNHLAPPKVGVTAAESGTYTDFANISLAGQRPDGSDGSNEVSFILLEIIDEMHLLQPSTNVQISRKTPERFLLEACRVISQGYGFPSVFNSDTIVEEFLRQGKTIEDAREGGTSGCVEAGAFGKEAYILTGYFNLPKVLELALHDGMDPRSQQQLGPHTGDPREFKNIDDLFSAWRRQLHHFLDIKIRGNQIIEQAYAASMPAPFLSIITDDCIQQGMDYNEGGARYNTTYIQGVGIGTLTDSLAAIQQQVFAEAQFTMSELLIALAEDFEGSEEMQQVLLNRSPKWGNDDDAADNLMRRAFVAYFDAVDGLPNGRGGRYHINMLPTTCHVYFGSVLGASPDGRHAGNPLSEGISPVQGMDRQGPTAVLQSAAKMDHVKTGGTLLNLKFTPEVLAGQLGLKNLAHLVRTYFLLGGHHVQFNVVDAATLRQAQAEPAAFRNLIVRVAGYSDYFCDLSVELQDEIIRRTEHGIS